jgi:hypothetical protein
VLPTARRTSSRRPQPLNALAALGAAGHNGFERWAGVGVFLEPWLGRRNTNILWSATLPLAFLRALNGDRRHEPMLAFNAGIAIAGAVVHYVAWPWSLRFGFMPWLDEAEGFRPRLLPAYNTILWLWFIGGTGSALTETRRENVKYAAFGVATAPLLLASARHHFAWARRQAEKGDPHFNPDLLADSPRRRVGRKDHEADAWTTPLR